MWGRKQQRELEARLDRLTCRVMVSETLYGMVTGLMLRAIPDDLRDGVLRELRKSVTVRTLDFDTFGKAETLELEIEERAQRLLDQIEHVARRDFAAPASPPDA